MAISEALVLHGCMHNRVFLFLNKKRVFKLSMPLPHVWMIYLKQLLFQGSTQILHYMIQWRGDTPRTASPSGGRHRTVVCAHVTGGVMSQPQHQQRPPVKYTGAGQRCLRRGRGSTPCSFLSSFLNEILLFEFLTPGRCSENAYHREWKTLAWPDVSNDWCLQYEPGLHLLAL